MANVNLTDIDVLLEMVNRAFKLGDLLNVREASIFGSSFGRIEDIVIKAKADAEAKEENKININLNDVSLLLQLIARAFKRGGLVKPREGPIVGAMVDRLQKAVQAGAGSRRLTAPPPLPPVYEERKTKPKGTN